MLPWSDVWGKPIALRLPARLSAWGAQSRSIPPSFNPANVLEDELRGIKAEKKLKAAFPMLNEEPPK
jgi:hypothetical protein